MAPAFADQGSRGVLRITEGTAMPAVRSTRIGINKSLLVELPTDAQDVVVSRPTVIDAVVVTPRRFYLMGKEPGEANVFFQTRDGRRILILDVAVTRDVGDLQMTLNRLFPGGRIRAEVVGEAIVLSGKVANAADAARAGEIATKFSNKIAVINLLATNAKEQVLLKVTVAEMQRDAIRRLGVNLPELIGTSGQFTFAKVFQNAFPVTAPFGAPATFAGGGVLPNATVGSVAQGTWASNGNTVSAMIQSLERVGVLRTLAEPNLTAVSGETAKFLAGGEFPIPIAGTNNTITVEWKQFGVNVAFTPVVLTEGRISLKVAAEVSELSNDGAVTAFNISLQALKVRRAETTVELPSGGALAIAGLLSDETRQSVEGVPELRNVPVLGQLFRSKDFRRRESELVVLVTPYVVQPAEVAELARPDKGFAPASELQGLFMGHLNRVYGQPGHVPAGRYEGDYGFVVEYPEDGGSG
jgi:pilus assembly protein CpaC